MSDSPIIKVAEAYDYVAKTIPGFSDFVDCAFHPVETIDGVPVVRVGFWIEGCDDQFCMVVWKESDGSLYGEW